MAEKKTEKKSEKKSGATTEKKTLTVRQVKSAARRPAVQAATLRGLGLGKIRREKVLEDTPAVRGMIRSIHHLVEVVGEKK